MDTNNSAKKLDEVLQGNYESLFQAEISGGLKKMRRQPNHGISCCCPFHDDTEPSFRFNTDTGLWQCYGPCGTGNYTSFVAKARNITNQEAFESLLKENGLWKEPHEKQEKRPIQKGKVPLTIAEYASQKKMDEVWLKLNFSLADEKRSNTTCVAFPYFDRDGNLVGPVRIRYGKRNGKNDFSWAGNRYATIDGKQVSLIGLYGAWKIPEYEENGMAILVEGESDTQSLCWMGLPGLGIPGAQMFNMAMTEDLLGIRKLYIHQENDDAGKTFVEKIINFLKQAEYTGDTFIWQSCKAGGYKDPSALLIAKGRDEARHIIEGLLKNADPRPVNAPAPIPKLIKGAPIDLRPPAGYLYSETGVFKLDKDTGEAKMIVSSPLLILNRLENSDDDELEKVEIAFLKRKSSGASWKIGVFPRASILGTKDADSIINFGIPTTQLGMRSINSYMLALENANMDVIPIVPCTSHYGWQSNGTFLPSEGGDIRRDMNKQQRDSVKVKGTLDGWLSNIAPIRERNWRLRLFLTVAFAAPLLKPCKCRTFGIYNWADSRSGKTAGLSAIASVWGDRDKYIIGFSSTSVGIEKTAECLSDLPLCLDERQGRGKDKKAQNDLEALIYNISLGRSRQKGTRDGGIAESQEWKTIMFMAGEQPFIESNTQNGVQTRMMQIMGGPFPEVEKEINKDALQLYYTIDENYGVAGLEFINKLLKVDQKRVREAYDWFYKEIEKNIKGTETGKYTPYIALMALADAMSQHWVFDQQDATFLYTEKDAQGALTMIKGLIQILTQDSPTNIHLNALEVLVDYVNIYMTGFLDHLPTEDDHINKVLGYRKGNIYYITAMTMKDIFANQDMSLGQHKAWFAELGILETRKKNNGGTAYSFNVRPVSNSESAPYYVVHMDKAIIALSEGGRETENFKEILDGDIDLPFD